MSDQIYELDVLRELLEEACVAGKLGKADKLFAAAYEAFRSGDIKTFGSCARTSPPASAMPPGMRADSARGRSTSPAEAMCALFAGIDSDSKVVQQLTTLRCPVAQP
jgi:hypothetical protein